MPAPNAATAEAMDPVAVAVANAPEDERPATEDEVAALRAAKTDPRPFTPGGQVTAAIAARARDEG